MFIEDIELTIDQFLLLGCQKKRCELSSTTFLVSLDKNNRLLA